MRTGRLSYTKDEAGRRRIDVAELTRVFGTEVGHVAKFPKGNGALADNDARTVRSNDSQYAPTAVQAGEIAALQARIAEQAETIRALWQRLDRSEAERERIQERLTGLLTHRQAGSVPQELRLEGFSFDAFIEAGGMDYGTVRCRTGDSGRAQILVTDPRSLDCRAG